MWKMTVKQAHFPYFGTSQSSLLITALLTSLLSVISFPLILFSPLLSIPYQLSYLTFIPTDNFSLLSYFLFPLPISSLLFSSLLISSLHFSSLLLFFIYLSFSSHNSIPLLFSFLFLCQYFGNTEIPQNKVQWKCERSGRATVQYYF